MHITSGARRIIALVLLIAAIPVAAASVVGGGAGLLWTASTGDMEGILGVALVYGAPILCAIAGVLAFNRGAYEWTAALSLPPLCLLLFFIATARF